MTFSAMLGDVLGGAAMSEAESRDFVGSLMDGGLSHVQAAALLTAVAARGDRLDEVVGAARAMRERSVKVEHGLGRVIDVCGTGGDGAGTINISTMAALVVAASGVPVAKHGNRAASSACGSADVLEACGMPLDDGPELAARSLQESRFAFMFAPAYHPSMRNVAPIRRELGVRTLFNLLGPLTNPAGATHQVVGVARESHVELVAEALRRLGTVRGAVVYGGGIDEVAGDRPSLVYEFSQNRANGYLLDPSDYRIHVPLAEIAGPTRSGCEEAFTSILQGERSGRSDVVALNAALALHVFGAAGSIAEGLHVARQTLASGAAYELFEGFGALQQTA
jgi:anthranilate phosphoribosyltransferase